jgi:hypothetical protein
MSNEGPAWITEKLRKELSKELGKVLNEAIYGAQQPQEEDE